MNEQVFPIKFNNWNFVESNFIAEIIEYDGHSDTVSLYLKDHHIDIPSCFLPGIKEHHRSDKKLKIKITLEMMNDE